ncbi:hypothetical protein, partial [Caballeronia sp. INML3B]|uniref:hypothetical protein n=1 Tax=Caballeronia sp. INML3B TaxID=2921749 RepID=UPI00202928C5
YLISKQQLVEGTADPRSVRKERYAVNGYCYLTTPSMRPGDIIEVCWFYPDLKSPKLFEMASLAVVSSATIVDLAVNTSPLKFRKWLETNR